MAEELLTYEQLSIAYDGAPAVRNASFTVHRHEILGIVGESGSGKSTLLKAAMGLLGPSGQVMAGAIWLHAAQGKAQAGRADRDRAVTGVLEQRVNLTAASHTQRQKICGAQMGMVFQDSKAALTPTRKVGDLFFETYRAHPEAVRDGASNGPASGADTGGKRAQRRACDARAAQLLQQLNVPDPARILRSYPFQLSGGIGQRVGIALAMLLNPHVLLADEPTSALDAMSQRQVAARLRSLADRRPMGIVLVTHNIALVRAIADTVLVLRAGETQEYGPASQVTAHPQSPYTRELLAAVPVLPGCASKNGKDVR